MKTRYKNGLAMGLCVILFAAGFARGEGAKPHAYFIAESEVTNPEADAKVIAKLPPTAARYGGRYLARGGKIVRFGADAPRRVIIAEFDSMDAVIAWRNDPEVKALEAEREKIGTKLRHYAVEALPQ